MKYPDVWDLFFTVLLHKQIYIIDDFNGFYYLQTFSIVRNITFTIYTKKVAV